MSTTFKASMAAIFTTLGLTQGVMAQEACDSDALKQQGELTHFTTEGSRMFGFHVDAETRAISAMCEVSRIRDKMLLRGACGYRAEGDTPEEKADNHLNVCFKEKGLVILGSSDILNVNGQLFVTESAPLEREPRSAYRDRLIQRYSQQKP